MDYQEKENSLTEMAELQLDRTFIRFGDHRDVKLTSEIANCIMDGAAEELAAIDPGQLDEPTQKRMLAVLEAIRGV